MGFSDAVKTFYKRFVDFSGRSSRSEYWWAQLYMWGVVIALVGIAINLAGGFEAFDAIMESGADMPGGVAICFLLIGLFVLSCFIPALALTVRRFHDHDRSGWWYVLVMILSIIPLFGLLISLALFVFLCLRGTIGSNRFGMDPLGPSAGATFD